MNACCVLIICGSACSPVVQLYGSTDGVGDGMTTLLVDMNPADENDGWLFWTDVSNSTGMTTDRYNDNIMFIVTMINECVGASLSPMEFHTMELKLGGRVMRFVLKAHHGSSSSSSSSKYVNNYHCTCVGTQVGRVMRAQLDGLGQVETLYTSALIQNPRQLLIEGRTSSQTNRQLFWSDDTSNLLFRMDMDGKHPMIMAAGVGSQPSYLQLSEPIYAVTFTPTPTVTPSPTETDSFTTTHTTRLTLTYANDVQYYNHKCIRTEIC